MTTEIGVNSFAFTKRFITSESLPLINIQALLIISAIDVLQYSNSH